VFNLAQVKV